VTIKPTLEYDAKKHTLQGPLLVTVLERRRGAPERCSRHAASERLVQIAR